MDPDLYGRRQRRRAAIGWTAVIVVALIAGLAVLGAALGNTNDSTTGDEGPVGIFTASMTSNQYDSIRNGEEKTVVLSRLGNVGMGASEVQEELLALFPHQPSGSSCAYWFLSDAPEHLVRLCFDDERGVLVQKSVAAQGEEEVPKTPV